MRRAGVLFVRCAVSDVAVHDDQRGAILAVLKRPERTGQHIQIVCIADTRHVPAVADETRGHVLGEGQVSVAFDRDVVVVVNPAKIRKLQVAGERGSFARDAFHHAAVSAQRVNIEVEQILEAGTVVARSQPLPGNGHADARRYALS